MTTTNEITIRDYEPIHQAWFEHLNRRWIEEYFVMEEVDKQVLQHPDEHIIAKGGQILMAFHNNEIAGTVALKFSQPRVFEFTKMAVAEKFHGKGIGKALASAAIDKAKSMGAHTIILYSSSKLKPALSLYRKLGFIDVPVDGPYKRSDVKMKLDLSSK